MARTAIVAALPALVLLWSWLRLERPPRGGWEALLVLVLALLPALAPGRWRRALAAVGAAVVAVPVIALDEPLDRRFHFVSPAAHRFGRGVARFYDVTLPFSQDEPAMRAVVLVAIFAFALALGLAVAARRPGLAIVVVLVGAGWPATLLDGTELLRGAGILVAALWILAGLRGTRGPVRPLLAGTVVLLAAVAASTSSGIARGAFLDWQSWGAGDSHRPSVSVAYVWESNYNGLHWPDEPTEVLRVHGPRRSLYWRATTLDAFRDGRWVERTLPLASPRRDPLLPARALRSPLVRQEFEVTGLVDTHLPAAATPVRYEADELVRYAWGGVAHVSRLERGRHYQVWSYAPRPTPKQLAGAAAYADPALARYLSLAGSATFAPFFGTPDRARRMDDLFAGSAADLAYRPLYERALTLAGRAASPYAAAVALESWFRANGGFAYDDQPPRAAGRPALVDFVVRTKAGYCQHFAGAMALMLRYLGIPARVGAGFTSGSYADGTWTVTDRDAHTWVEAYFPGWGWLPFDPTPGRGQLDGSYTVSSAAFDASGAAAQLPSGSRLRNDLAQRARANPQIVGERPTSRGGGPLRPVAGAKRSLPILIVLALIALAAGSALWLAKLVLGRVRLSRAREPHAVALASRRALVAYAADQGLELPEGATLRELVPLLRQQLGVDAEALAAAATAAAYAPPGTAADAADAVRRELRLLLRALRGSLPASRRLRGAVSLRSL